MREPGQLVCDDLHGAGEVLTGPRAHPRCAGVHAVAALARRVREIVAQRLGRRAREICSGDRWEELTEAVVANTTDPWTAADEMLAPVDA